MPRVEEIKTKLNGAKFFTKLDLQNAFHHVKLAEKSREMTTFMAPAGDSGNVSIQAHGVRS